jgi:D-erythro-7,8-dihydroneopterin triphosphate epimerase
MGTISVKNLRLKTIIGFNPEERVTRQDVVINYELQFDTKKAEESDRIEDTVDYKKINKEIIGVVEKSNYNLLEKLTHEILDILRRDTRIIYAKVEVDKPGALRFADSVSASLEYGKKTS